MLERRLWSRDRAWSMLGHGRSHFPAHAPIAQHRRPRAEPTIRTAGVAGSHWCCSSERKSSASREITRYEVVEFGSGAFFMTWQWSLSPRIAGKALHGQNDNELWKSEKSDTLTYTVAHSSFSMKRERSHKHVVKSGTCK
jgi:hypothetical protein